MVRSGLIDVTGAAIPLSDATAIDVGETAADRRTVEIRVGQQTRAFTVPSVPEEFRTDLREQVPPGVTVRIAGDRIVREQEGERLVADAERALEEGNFSAAIDRYESAVDCFRALAERSSVDESEQERFAERADTVEAALRAARERLRTREEVTERLNRAESTFQEAVAAHCRGRRTLSKTRYRQARSAFETVLETVRAADVPVLTPPIAVAVAPTAEIPTGDLTAVRGVDESLAERLLEADVRSLSTAEAATVTDVEGIDETTAARLRALTWWHGDDTGRFGGVSDVEARASRAARGFEAVR